MSTVFENQTSAGATQVSTLEDDVELKELLKKSFRPRTNEAADAVQTAVGTLLQFVRRDKVVVYKDVLKTVDELVAEIDAKISKQLTKILHHPDMQKLEGAWRGLHYLVSNTEVSANLRIRVMNISKKELGRTLRHYKGGAWDQSPIFKKVYEQEFGQFGGQPFGCLVGDYEFNHSPHDVALLTEMAKIAASAHAPFISAAAPGTMQMDSWSELANPRDISKIFQAVEYASWRRLRESNDSRYLSLTLPRFLARLPYGAHTCVF